MNIDRVKQFLSNPAICVVPGTATLALDFCYRLGEFPTPRMRIMDDGAVRIRWLRGHREVKVYFRGLDVNFSMHSKAKGDAVPRAVVKARTVQKAMKIGLRWLSQAV